MKTSWYSVLTIILEICSYNARIEGMQSTPAQGSIPILIDGLPTSETPRQPPTPIVLLPTSNPNQKLCQNVKALTIPTSFIAPNQKSSWVVSRVTKMEQLQTNPDLSNMNTCSFVSYLAPYCKGVNFKIITLADGRTSTLETFGYNSRLKNVVHFEQKMTLGDDNYLIYQLTEITRMEYISSGGAVKPVSVPDAVRSNHGFLFAVIALEPSFKYAIFQSCDRKNAWVAFSEEFINSQPDIAIMDAYEKEIEDSLYRNGIDVSKMVDIDFTFHELTNLVIATNSDGSPVGFNLEDVEKEFIKLICKIMN